MDADHEMNLNEGGYTYIMQPVSLKDLLEAGCHFGHKADRWHPKASSFIFQEREGIHVIDLAKTKSGLERAARYVYDLASEGKTVLFIGTKRQAAPVIREEAARVGAPFMGQRWVGGFLTNWEEVHKNLEKIRRLTEEQTTGAWKKYPKHERVKLGRYLHKLSFLYGGVVQLHERPAAIFVIDVKKEKVAVYEARRMNTPVIGIVDTNSDPEMADYVIPSNDDAIGAVKFLIHYMAEAYREGKEYFEKNAKQIEDSKTENSKTEGTKTEAGKTEDRKAVNSETVKKSIEEKKPAAKVQAIKTEEKKTEATKTEEKPKKSRKN